MNEQEKAVQNLTDTSKTTEKAPVSSIIPDGVAYYPGFGEHGKKRHPDERLIAYAAACIEIVRLLNDKAATLYNQVVQIGKEPECQEIFAKLKIHYQRRPYDTANLVETFRRDPLSESASAEITVRMEGLHYPPTLKKSMGDFVLQGFNAPDDIRYDSPKVILDLEIETPLGVALATNVYYDALGLNQPLYDYIKQGSVSDLFSSTPGPRHERRRKKSIIASFHKLGSGAVNKQTLIYGAELWYKCRVTLGKLVLVCDEISRNRPKPIEESALSRWIEPYDHATGYPR